MSRDRERVYDEYLVASARAGDRAALGEVVGRWQRRFLGHAWRLTGDAELSRDVVQEAWMEIVRGLARLDDAAAFPAWAFRVVTRRAAKAIGRAQRQRRTLEALAGEPRPEPARTAEHQIDGATVRVALGALPAAQRVALGLFYLEEMSVAEIALALEVPEGTVKTRLMHARRKVRDQLGDRDA